MLLLRVMSITILPFASYFLAITSVVTSTGLEATISTVVKSSSPLNLVGFDHPTQREHTYTDCVALLY